MLTKKDFMMIATTIASHHDTIEACDGDFYEGGRYDAANNIAWKLADYFATQNPRFDRSRFMKACGLTE